MKTNMKKILIPLLIMSAVYFSLLAAGFFCIKKISARSINGDQAVFLERIMEKNGMIDDDDVIDLLRNGDAKGSEEAYEKLVRIFEKYGYEESDIYSSGTEEVLVRFLVFFIILSALFIIFVVILIFLERRRRDRKEDELSSYLEGVLDGNYSLRIEENSEEELSRISNDIYKVTVLLREASENSRKESENLSTALADISHQIKTPLTSIRIMLDNIEDDPDMETETRAQFIRLIGKQTDLISGLVVSLLNMAKFDAGTIRLNRVELDMREVICEAAENLGVLMEVKGVELSIGGSKKALITADKRWQLEAFTNIIKNCIEHSRNDSVIDVELDDSRLFTRIIIRDHGEGITKKDLPHIFERFYKPAGSSKDGAGIGLAFAKTIIEKEGGYIYCESEEGSGCTFTIKYLK